MATDLLTIRLTTTNADIATDVQTSLAANNVTTTKLAAFAVTPLARGKLLVTYVYYA